MNKRFDNDTNWNIYALHITEDMLIAPWDYKRYNLQHILVLKSQPTGYTPPISVYTSVEYLWDICTCYW